MSLLAVGIRIKRIVHIGTGGLRLRVTQLHSRQHQFARFYHATFSSLPLLPFLCFCSVTTLSSRVIAGLQKNQCHSTSHHSFSRWHPILHGLLRPLAESLPPRAMQMLQTLNFDGHRTFSGDQIAFISYSCMLMSDMIIIDRAQRIIPSYFDL